MTEPHVAVVLLSMGNRPTELARALAALNKQRGVRMDVVLLGNGWVPEGVPDWVRTMHSAENLGCPAGRNVGADEARGDYLFFYDDDGEIVDDTMLLQMVQTMQAEPDVAVVQPRGVDYDGLPAPRRWSPRLRTNGADAGGDVAVFWEAMAMIRRSAFEQVGGWAGEFMFGHEGVDLAMKLLDHGWRIRYAPSLLVRHPARPSTAHHHFYTTARNRAWVARRNLPAVLVPCYLLSWALVTIVRTRNPKKVGTWFKGLWDGLRSTLPGRRQPISWRTVWLMTKLGRPPLW